MKKKNDDFNQAKPSRGRGRGRPPLRKPNENNLDPNDNKSTI